MARQTVYTEYGPVSVDEALLKIWNQYGWPADEALEAMAAEQRVDRVTKLAGGESGVQ